MKNARQESIVIGFIFKYCEHRQEQQDYIYFQQQNVYMQHELYANNFIMYHYFRTPRLELSKKVTPSKIGSFLSKCMHDEDNKYGIHVTNKKGDKWIAYGDGMLLNDESRDNYKMSINAVQESVNQVFRAFLSPDERTSSSLVSDYIPYVDTSQKNNYPMFQVSDWS